MMNRARQIVPALMVLLGVQSAWACGVAPAGQLIGVDEQIAGAVNITVVQVLGATPTGDGRLNYDFLVQERLAGIDRRSFILTEAEPVRGLAQDSSFDNHEDPAAVAA